MACCPPRYLWLASFAIFASCGEVQTRFVEDDNPNAITFGTPATGLSSDDSTAGSSGAGTTPGTPGAGAVTGAGDPTLGAAEASTVSIDDPFDIVVTTDNPAAIRVAFEVDGQPVGVCDSTDATQDCKTDSIWHWTVTFPSVGLHTVGASFVSGSHTVRASTTVQVIQQVTGGQIDESSPDEADPYGEQLVEEGTSTTVEAIDAGRGFLDPSRPQHALCGGTTWAVQGQRVVLGHGRIDGATSEVARCVQRYGTVVRRVADLAYVSRASVYSALVAAGNCTDDGAWHHPLVSGSQCVAVNRSFTRENCTARMTSSPDFAIDAFARYVSSRSIRLRHRYDPPVLAAMLSTGGAVRCSRANHWHLLSSGNYIDRFVGAYNAYRTSETGSDLSPPPNTTVSAVDFTIAHDVTLASSFVGVGAQFNQNLFTPTSRALHPAMNDVVLAALPAQLQDLGARHVRIFFDSHAFTDSTQMDSFQQTVRLAQQSGATVNVTYWHGPYPTVDMQMSRFADVLASLRTEGITAVQYVTIQNEVNSTRVTPQVYEQLYRSLDAALRTRGIRDTIHFVGGDLLRDGQGDWIQYMGAHMSDVLDGYSVHIYWDVAAPGYLATRLTEVRKLVDDLPAAQRRPLYVMEYGARGVRTDLSSLPDSARLDVAGCRPPRTIPFGQIDPGRTGNDLVADSAQAAWQHAWFDVLAASMGYVGLSKWDAYPASYDCGPQDYGLLGLNSAGWEPRPTYLVTQLVDHFALPGWRILRTDGGSDTSIVATFRSTAGDWSILATNTSATPRVFRINGLPSTTPFHLVGWASPAPRSFGHSQIRTDVTGAALFRVPAHGLVGIATADPGL